MAFGRRSPGALGPFRGKIVSQTPQKDGMVKLSIRNTYDGKTYSYTVAPKSQLLRFNQQYQGDVSFILDLDGNIESLGKIRPSIVRTLKRIGEY
ncbi:hypothetical protein KY325_02370 [Candidatus Woesearchaeota archaeon]|nr:hypothetical protein [Candidatus Woesearchaeota archaeon]MBW3017979.1 hypothetical protein [Candidatus Woesearchaeota archaeon]